MYTIYRMQQLSDLGAFKAISKMWVKYDSQALMWGCHLAGRLQQCQRITTNNQKKQKEKRPQKRILLRCCTDSPCLAMHHYTICSHWVRKWLDVKCDWFEWTNGVAEVFSFFHGIKQKCIVYTIHTPTVEDLLWLLFSVPMSCKWENIFIKSHESTQCCSYSVIAR